ncbi:MAG: hypothetical protein WBA22_01910 [Candidatus Methanofastidiosia archaeon]
MLVMVLKKKEEFLKVCQGRVIYFTVDSDLLHYFTPYRANDIEVLYRYDSGEPLPFREDCNLKDEKGVYVQYLIELERIYCLRYTGKICHESGRIAEIY